MIRTAVRTVVLVVAVLLLAQVFPEVAQYQTPLLIAAVAVGLVGFLLRAVGIIVVLVGLWLLLMN